MIKKATPTQFNIKEVKLNGFWTVIDVKGGSAPTSKENATLFLSKWGQQEWLTLIGGSQPTFGTS
jgi:hypothetical protein